MNNNNFNLISSWTFDNYSEKGYFKTIEYYPKHLTSFKVFIGANWIYLRRQRYL